MLLIAGAVLAGFSYVAKLKSTFLKNVQFYIEEIATHDKKSVDLEIEEQWERLEVIGRKLRLETYESGLDLMRFLNLEMTATGFEGLMLLDDQGLAYEANYLVHNVGGFDWASRFLEEKEPFVLQNEMRYQFIVRDSSLLEYYHDSITMADAHAANEATVVNFTNNLPNWAGVRQAFYPNIRDLLLGTIAPEQAAEGIDRSCNQAVREAGG